MMHLNLSSKAPVKHHVEPLRWIGAYKLAKAALAIVGGLLVLRLMHRNLPELATHLMNRFRISPHSLAGQFILRKVIAIHGRNLQALAILLFAYAPLGVAEGIGLMMRQVWAEWLTLVLTCLLIPLEVYECFRRPTWVRVVILVLNILVAIYLAVRIKHDHKRRRMLESVARDKSAAGPVQQQSDAQQSGDPKK